MRHDFIREAHTGMTGGHTRSQPMQDQIRCIDDKIVSHLTASRANTKDAAPDPVYARSHSVYR